MFTRIQARHFRSMKILDQRLRPFQALVGPNASGKTTFLDVLGLLSDILKNRGEVEDVLYSRSVTFEKLVWMGSGDRIELAIEAEIPDFVSAQMATDKQRFSKVRYEIAFDADKATNEIGIAHETLWLLENAEDTAIPQRNLFPDVRLDTDTLFLSQGKSRKVAIKKAIGGNDNYYTEGAKSYQPSFKLGKSKSALANLPADTESFPVSTWFKNMLGTGVQNVVLNSQMIKQPSPPGKGLEFRTDGSNLPWVVDELRRNSKQFSRWLGHIQTALEDIKDVYTYVREEDRHRYLIVEYSNGAKVPSWLVSDGTLRLLALTILAYLPSERGMEHDNSQRGTAYDDKRLDGVYLIEEPENGIHPRAIETILQSLMSIYSGQVLIATHSPVALNMLSPQDILCFAKNMEGATDVVSGDQHPGLQEWKQERPNLGLLYASGILS